MNRHLHTLPIEALYLLEKCLAQHRGITAIVSIALVRPVIRLTQIPGEPLYAAVRDNLDSGNNYTAAGELIQCQLTREQTGPDLIKERKKRHSQGHLIVSGHGTQQAGDSCGHTTCRRGCYAILQILGSSELGHLPSVRDRQIECFIPSMVCRGFLKNPIWPALIGGGQVTHNVATLGIRGCFIDMELCQRG